MNILVTGGAGYIGSHTVRALLSSRRFTPVVFDNLSTGHAESVPEGTVLVKGDIHDIDFVADTLKKYNIEGVIHFAAYSLVGESMVDPAKYYTNNVEGTLHLLLGMKKAGVDKIVFSSTAAVYGEPEKTPIEEDFPHNPTNVYGRTKLVIENMMRDFTNAYGLHYVALRYFNAAGAALDGSIGEDHNPESHLIPLILKTAQGVRDHIAIYGTDYPTPDGTGVRDYIHVVDLARGHVCAIRKLETKCGLFICNLGTGKGYSVLDVIHAFSKACGKEIPYVIDPRRPGDIAECYADPTKAKNELGWVAEYGIEEMCADSWNWQKNNPDGYHTVK